MQQALVYLILSSAVFYLGYRAYLILFKKKTGCEKCPANENA
jgi:hypothetical protein